MVLPDKLYRDDYIDHRPACLASRTIEGIPDSRISAAQKNLFTKNNIFNYRASTFIWTVRSFEMVLIRPPIVFPVHSKAARQQ
jgi:hypothetical protein